MKIVLTTLLSVFAFFSVQGQGIQFEEGEWKDVLDKAQKTDKVIYLDAYAVWCGPCKMMTKNIFPDEEVGKVYNDLFINYSVDAEKGEGIELARKYKVTAYPTHLYINPHTEEVVSVQMGAVGAPTFIAWANEAQKQFRDTLTLQFYAQQFQEGKRDQDFLVSYIEKASAQQQSTAIPLQAFYELNKHEIVEKYWDFMLEYTNDFNSEPAAFMKKMAHEQRGQWSDQELLKYENWYQTQMSSSLMEAINQKDLSLIDRISESIIKEGGNHYMMLMPYDLYHIYYQQLKEEQKLFENNIASLDYLAQQSSASLFKFTENQTQFMRNIVIAQLKNSMANSHNDIDVDQAIDAFFEENKLPNQTEIKSIEYLETTQKIIDDSLKEYYSNAILWHNMAVEITDDPERVNEMNKQYLMLLILEGKVKQAKKESKKMIKLGQISFQNENATSLDQKIKDNIKL